MTQIALQWQYQVCMNHAWEGVPLDNVGNFPKRQDWITCTFINDNDDVSATEELNLTLHIVRAGVFLLKFKANFVFHISGC